jgi:hypothetical protein
MIEYLPGHEPKLSKVTAEVEYVCGPRGGQREERQQRPAVIEAERGAYRRSIQCADDGRLPYVWEPGPAAEAFERRV